MSLSALLGIVVGWAAPCSVPGNCSYINHVSNHRSLKYNPMWAPHSDIGHRLLRLSNDVAINHAASGGAYGAGSVPPQEQKPPRALVTFDLSTQSNLAPGLSGHDHCQAVQFSVWKQASQHCSRVLCLMRRTFGPCRLCSEAVFCDHWRICAEDQACARVVCTEALPYPRKYAATLMQTLCASNGIVQLGERAVEQLQV